MRFLNVSKISFILRALVLALKFIIVFLLAEYLSVEDYGMFVYIQSFLALSVYFIGMDYYTVSNKEFILDNKKASRLLKEKLVLYLSNSIFFIIVLVVLSRNGVVTFSVPLILIFILCLFEHLSQEVCRDLLSKEKVIPAMLSLLLRGGGWIFPILIVLAVTGKIALTTTIILWAVFSFLSIFFWYFYYAGLDFSGFWRESISVDSLLIKLKSAMNFFISSLITRFLFFYDKSMLGYDNEVLGRYALVFTLMIGVFSLVDAGIIVVKTPKLVKIVQLESKERIQQVFMKFCLSIVMTFVVLTISVIGVFVVLVKKFGFFSKYEFFYEEIFYIFVMFFVYTINMSLYTLLYAIGKNKSVLVSSALMLLPVFFIQFFTEINIQLICLVYVVAFSISILFRIWSLKGGVNENRV